MHRGAVLALGSGLCRVSRLRGEAFASDWEETKGTQWQDLSTHRRLWEPDPRIADVKVSAGQQDEGSKSDVSDLKK